MRWDIIKKAWRLARDKYPTIKTLYVDIPPKFQNNGTCNIYDLAESTAPLGTLAYEASAKNGTPIVQISIEDAKQEIEASRTCQIVKTATDRTPVVSAALDTSLMASRSKDGFDLGRKLALLYASGKELGTESDQAITSWLAEIGAENNLLVPVEEALTELGFSITTEKTAAFNLKAARGENEFEVNDRVRVVCPTSMEYQECGRVLEIKGNAKKGYWYAVLVDGSSEPLWFPEKSLEVNEAGDIVDPTGQTDE